MKENYNKVIKSLKVVFIFSAITILSLVIDSNPSFGKLTNKTLSSNKTQNVLKTNIIQFAQNNNKKITSYKKLSNGFEATLSNSILGKPEFWLIKVVNNNNEFKIYAKQKSRGIYRLTSFLDTKINKNLISNLQLFIESA